MNDLNSREEDFILEQGLERIREAREARALMLIDEGEVEVEK